MTRRSRQDVIITQLRYIAATLDCMLHELESININSTPRRRPPAPPAPPAPRRTAGKVEPR